MTTMPTIGREIVLEICEALGLKHVSMLNIHFALNKITTVTAKFYPEVDGIKQIPAIIKKYRLRIDE